MVYAYVQPYIRDRILPASDLLDYAEYDGLLLLDESNACRNHGLIYQERKRIRPGANGLLEF